MALILKATVLVLVLSMGATAVFAQCAGGSCKVRKSIKRTTPVKAWFLRR